MRIFICITCIFIAFVPAHAQQTVLLQWKLTPGKLFTYNTVMQTIDTARFKEFSLSNEELTNTFSNNKKDRIAATEQFFAALSATYHAEDMEVNMMKKKSGVIDIEMDLIQRTTTAPGNKDSNKNIITEFPKAMKQMAEKVRLRGAVNEDGSLQSFYVRTDQKNIIALLFELPNHEIKVGDSWPLSVNFISMDQNFACDSSFKVNTCTLVDLKKTNAGTVALLKYNLAEYVTGDYFLAAAGGTRRSSMRMTYNALAEFSVENGRWSSYDAVMTMHTTGAFTSATAQKLALIPR